jgi:hypothetical protein
MRLRILLFIVVPTCVLLSLYVSGYRSVWVPGHCGPLVATDHLKGDKMVFILPPGTVVAQGRDIDYQTRTICHGDDCMQLGWGPLWSSGVLPSEYLQGIQGLTKRFILGPKFGLFGTEYKALGPDATYCRWVVTFGETIGHNHAGKEAAESFDKIIDTLCWDRNQ